MPEPHSPAPRVGPGDRRSNGVAAATFARLAGRVTRTTPPAVFTVLGRGRRTFWGWLGFAAALMPFGSLPRPDSELVILRVAWLRGSDYEIAHHRRLARRAGLDREQIAAALTATDASHTVSVPGSDARAGRSPAPEAGGHVPRPASFSYRQAMLVQATDELLATDDLSEATWGRLHAELGDRGCVEFLLLAGHYRMLATTLHTLRVVPDPPTS